MNHKKILEICKSCEHYIKYLVESDTVYFAYGCNIQEREQPTEDGGVKLVTYFFKEEKYCLNDIPKECPYYTEQLILNQELCDE